MLLGMALAGAFCEDPAAPNPGTYALDLSRFGSFPITFLPAVYCNGMEETRKMRVSNTTSGFWLAAASVDELLVLVQSFR